MKLCPGCGRLMFADELKRLAAAAAAATQASQLFDAIQHWRGALELLPDGTVQANEVRQRIDALVRVSGPVAATPSTLESRRNPATGKFGVVGAMAVMIWKFKWLLGMVLTKGKLLLFGLTKVSTLATMALAVGAYSMAWGWSFALGLVLVIYVHEMGHVFALQRLGMRASAPIFIPGFGALIRLRQAFASPVEDAYVGLAGPLWGLFAAVATAVLYAATRLPVFAALTQVGAWINLFNLLPIGPLDGGRGIRALSYLQRWMLLLVVLGSLIASGEGLLVLILIVAGFRTMGERSSATTVSWKTLAQFAVLVLALTALAYFFDTERLGVMLVAQAA